MTVTISTPVLRETEQACEAAFPVTGLAAESLRFFVTGADRSFVSCSLNSALVALLIPAMTTGQDIHLKGSVSPELLFRVRHYVIPLLQIAIPGAKTIRIDADDLEVSSLAGPAAVVTGLSSGIDSFHVCSLHLGADLPEAMRLTHFVFYDVGSHGESRNIALADDRLSRARAAASEFGLPLINVSSNMGDFYTLDHQQTHTLRSSATALLLSGRVSRYLFASTVPYPAVAVRKVHDIADLDSILLPLIKTEAMDCFSVGSAQTRVEKTAAVAELEIAQRRLDVCVHQFPNCSKCWKCARTIATLELLGKLDDFSQCFDLAAYGRVRDRYVAHIEAAPADNALAREVRDLMQRSGVRPTPRQIALSSVARPLQRAAATGRLPKGRGIYRKLLGFPYDH